MSGFSWTNAQTLLVLTILLKLGFGALAGGVIGFERELHGRPAGVRTHMLVIIGVILICESSRHFGGGSDTTRIAAQIVSGVGFLGAGTILRMGAEVRGLTSAASIWAVSAIGMAIGAGGPLLVVALIATVLVLLTLSVVDRIERRLAPRVRAGSLELELQTEAVLPAVLGRLERENFKVVGVRILEDGSACGVSIEILGDGTRSVPIAAAVAGVRSAKWMD